MTMRRDKILDLTKKFPKMSSYTIAERLGCHAAYVRAVWHRNGIFRRKHNPNISYQKRIWAKAG